MNSHRTTNNELLPHLFRLEYSKMTAVLCRYFGLKHIETAEDIVSDTFLKAAEHWAVNGIPENPTAWLYMVAKNKTKDYFRHLDIVENQSASDILIDNIQEEPDFDVQIISDSQLAMIFAVCNPANSKESQICLALQILCGFSVEEIANAFLTKTETIKKRLQRARTQLRNDRFQIKLTGATQIKLRLDTVLRTLYLLFNEGYYSKSHNQTVRKELCSEAVRLTLLLTDNPLTLTPQVNALLALMCYQSSRLDARTDPNGELILYDAQDRSLWDSELIERGNAYLVNACDQNEVTKYHLEAGIAYWHTTPTDDHKWLQILNLYNQLILIEYSPATALNRTFAYARVYGAQKAIPEAEKLNLQDNIYYHQLLGYLYSGIDNIKAITHYEKAIALTSSKTQKKALAKEIQQLTENQTPKTNC